MARNFPLAGLLGLRRLEENQAAAELSAANARKGALRDRQDRAWRELNGSPVEAPDATALHWAATARASSHSMLADLTALAALAEDDAAQAQAKLQAARARTTGLEKLQDHHMAALAAEDLRGEQSVLDEIAATSWHRRKENFTR